MTKLTELEKKMKKIKQMISILLVTLFAAILTVGCSGCAKTNAVPEPTNEREIVRDYYGPMLNVQPLNWSEFDEAFIFVENENPALSHWIFQIQPRFPDLSVNYEWNYFGQETTFIYNNGINTYKRYERISMSNSYVVTFVPDNYFTTSKYLIYGKFRDSTHFLYSFQIDWQKRITIPDGGITFAYPNYFEYAWYWQNYCEDRVPTILEWRNV